MDVAPGSRLTRAVLIIFASLGFFGALEASTNFYVDPDWSGAKSGTQAHPFAVLDKSAWNRVNAALRNGNVTIYFSAREASTDTTIYYGRSGRGSQLEVDLTKKTTRTPFLLTLDGMSLYNSNHSSPSWITNTGTNMCVVRDFLSQNSSHTKYSNITIHGFKIICNASTKAVSICGDNWTVEACNVSHAAPAADGPCVLVVPTADGAHEGSNSYAPPCSNIVISHNIIHDSFGEGVYLGGGGSKPGQPGSGYPSHHTVTVEFNEIYNTGVLGGQGDGIDVKGGIQGLILRGNDIHNINLANGCRGIVAQGQIASTSGGTLQVIERNYIHNCSQITEGIALSDTWGVPAGVVIRNNVISGVTGSTGARAGINIYSTQDQTLIQNNTIYSSSGLGIGTSSGSNVVLRNNLLIANNAGGNQVDLSHGTIDSDYNGYSGMWGYSREGPHSVGLSSLDAIKSLVNPADGDFHLLAGAPIIGKALVQSSFGDDYSGATRGLSWDIGAFNATGPSD
jgi:Right handed beta helix region